jgi:hypothetical protein
MKHYVDICNIVDGDVSAEVIATDFEGIVVKAKPWLLCTRRSW